MDYNESTCRHMHCNRNVVLPPKDNIILFKLWHVEKEGASTYEGQYSICLCFFRIWVLYNAEYCIGVLSGDNKNHVTGNQLQLAAFYNHTFFGLTTQFPMRITYLSILIIFYYISHHNLCTLFYRLSWYSNPCIWSESYLFKPQPPALLSLSKELIIRRSSVC
jgi:hypothetical protein